MTGNKEWLRVLKSETASLVIDLFRCPMFFEARGGWEVASDGISLDLFYFCLRGRFEARSGSLVRIIRAGDVLWIPSGNPFCLALKDPAGVRFARFRAGLKEAGASVASRRKTAVYSAGETTTHWLDTLRAQIAAEKARGYARGLRLALAGLLNSIGPHRPVLDTAPELRRFSATERNVILGWAESLPPASRPGPADLAVLMRMTPDYCARLFRRSFGQSFEKWMIALRIRAAAQRLLESRLSVSEVAAEFAYSTPFFFSRQFKEVLGCSPKEYRAEA